MKEKLGLLLAVVLTLCMSVSAFADAGKSQQVDYKTDYVRKGEEKKLLSVVDSIFASGYLTEGGQGIEDTLKTITDAGFTYEIESA